MESPLYDHDLDATPPAPRSVVGRGGFSKSDGWKPSSPPGERVGLFLKNYFLFIAYITLGPLLIPIAALAPRSWAGRFLGRSEPGGTAGLFLGRNFLRLLLICHLALWLIPIAVLAPRALRSRFLDRWAGVSLFLYSGLFLLMVLTSAAALLPMVVAWPYLGVACLLGLSTLAADYLRQTRDRFRRFQTSNQRKGASSFTRMLVAFGFQDGTIPPSLRVFVVWGMIGGIFATIALAMDLNARFGAAPGEGDHQVVLVGEGIVRGVITYVDGGPYSYGTEGSVGEHYAGVGTSRQPPAERGWVRFRHGGLASGEDLTVEMRGRGIVFQGRPALQSWLLVMVAYLLSYVLLVVACATAARGKPIGFVLYLTWAFVALGYKILITAWVPESARLEELIFCLLYPAAALAVLSQPGVRSYLGRPRGRTVLGKPSKVSESEFEGAAV